MRNQQEQKQEHLFFLTTKIRNTLFLFDLDNSEEAVEALPVK